MKIQDLQQPYRALAEMRREQQINSEWVKRYQQYYEIDEDMGHAFEWKQTKEGNSWWYDTIEGEYPEIPAASLEELKEWQNEHPEYDAVLIAEQPKEKTLFVRLLQSQSHVWHYSKVGQIFEVAPFDKDCYLVVGVNPKEHGFNEPLFISHSDCKVLASSGQPNLLEVKDNQLFTAAVAAMQGMLANESFSNPEEGLPDLSVAWDYAEALINEGKKRGKLD